MILILLIFMYILFLSHMILWCYAQLFMSKQTPLNFHKLSSLFVLVCFSSALHFKGMLKILFESLFTKESSLVCYC